MSTEEAKQQFDENKANEAMDRYSRAIAALGVDTMRNLGALNVLVIGLKGVGVETAKNLILAGPRSVTLHDNDTVAIEDLNCNFYLRPQHVGASKRAAAVASSLAELNPYVHVEVSEAELTNEFVATFGAVVVCKTLPKSELVRLNAAARAAHAAFILALTHGVTATFFSDFGDEHVITDADGEPKKTLVVEGISATGVVHVAGDNGHGLDDGDLVSFDEVQGLAINGVTFPIKRIFSETTDPKTGKKRTVQQFNQFQVDTPNFAEFGAYVSGGIVTEVKKRVTLNFRPLAASLSNPIIGNNFYGQVAHPDQLRWMTGVGSQVHLAVHALLQFLDEHGALPQLHSADDAAKVIAIAKRLNEEAKAADGLFLEEVDEKAITKTALYARAELPGYAAFLGGVAAQEVVKKFGKFTPQHQWLHVENFELVGDNVAADAAPVGSRYDHQIAVFGKAFQDKIASQKWFMVGCGALGCEYLKGYAMMGLGTAPGGYVAITDMDRIELSNLSRQFLFRAEHVGKPKSVSAAKVGKTMNPDMNIITYEIKVCDETENVFDDAFWSNLDGVWNALDNVHARRYTDTKCLFYTKPLLESGTQGTKANSEIILPHATTSYSDHKEQETGGIAACTLRNFPHLIEHCIEWARPQFEELFELTPKNFNTLVENRDKFFAQVRKESNTASQLELLQSVKSLLEKSKVRTFEACVHLALEQFTKQYDFRIRDLTHSFPEDARVTDKETGEDLGPFWSGHKRFPRVAAFDLENEAHLEYLFTASNLFAFMFGLEHVRDKAAFKALAANANLQVPAWQPPSKNVSLDDEKKGDEKANTDDDAQLEELFKFFADLDLSTLSLLKVNEFEKDDDTNFHIDFVTICSNMRAWNYRIKETSRLNCKLIAGRIIPALATTTAMITGLVSIEFYKLLLGLPAAEFRNANVNLAMSTFNFFEVSEPFKAQKGFDVSDQRDVIPYPDGFTSWDKIVIDQGDMTLGEFVEAFPKIHHGVVPSLLFKHGITAKDIEEKKGKYLYLDTDGMLPDRRAAHNANLAKKVSELYKETYGDFVNPNRNWIALDGAFEDADGNGAIVPFIKYVFKH
eukprot:TRINITY_DN24_c0_g1_i5.p1 TRINITY_DN24_c0_g1~~TRINITY_DN24_c0_g1_i5.p1  ORF type:complete len:1100 (-),score=574.74 TRINITY_DN24_c0_g1_i5:196-3444(-)